MTGSVLHLSTDELWSALEDINPVDVLIDELIGSSLAGAGWNPDHAGRLTPWPVAGAAQAEELALFEDTDTGEKCLLPLANIRLLRTATLATLAARALLAPGVVTAAVLGSGLAAQSQLTILAQHVPDVSHVAVCGSAGETRNPVEPRVLDQLDLAGIGLTVTNDINEAVLGSNLVITTGACSGHLELTRLANGSVVINASGGDLPDTVVNGVDQVYVDDASLIDQNGDRHFVAMHHAARTPRVEWRPRVTDRPRHRRIGADLRELLTGKHSGRRSLDDVVLVELLSADTLDTRLTSHLHRAALKRGLGVRLPE